MTLKEYLKDAKLNYSQFAELVGVSPSTVQRWALGERIPDKENMPVIAEATGGKVAANDFFGLAA